jgi:hypothetical protein
VREPKLKAADANVRALQISAVPGCNQLGVRAVQAELVDVIFGVAML